MSCCHCQGSQKIFSNRYVSKELKRYHKKGPRPTTRMLLDALRAEGTAGATVLDVGGGFGMIPLELLEDGLAGATLAEYAAAYLEAAQTEVERKGHAGRMAYRRGDFVEIAGDCDEADIVTLDRVICCYPDMESLVELSVGKARRLYGVVYPRDTWLNKIGGAIANLLFRITRNPFRVYAHSSEAVDQLVTRVGFELCYHRRTPLWQVAVYRR